MRVKDVLKILLVVFALLMLGTLSMALDLTFDGTSQRAGGGPTATPSPPPSWSLPASGLPAIVPTPALPPYPVASPPSVPPQLPTPALWPYPHPWAATPAPAEGQVGSSGLPTPAALPSP